MLPHTHFLVALLLGVMGVKYNLFSYHEAFIIAFISMLIDLDHLFSYYLKHRRWSIKQAWNAAIVKHEQERSFIQHQSGFILVSFFLFILLFINKKVTFILGLAYYT